MPFLLVARNIKNSNQLVADVIETVEVPPVVEETPVVEVPPVVETPVETPVVETPVVETPAEVTEEVTLTDEVKAFILKSITTAKEESSEVIANLQKQLSDTETKLEAVLNKARNDGPKRTAAPTDNELKINKARDHEREAQRLRNEANHTSDLELAKSYNARAVQAELAADEIRKTL